MGVSGCTEGPDPIPELKKCVGELEDTVDTLDSQVSDVLNYVGSTDSDLKTDIAREVRASVNDTVTENALASMANILYLQFGDMTEMHKMVNYWSPTVLFNDYRCIDQAIIVESSVPEPWKST